jgi:hypothetical protein
MIDDDKRGAVDETRIGRGNRSTREKPAPVPLYQPQIPHDLTWDRTRAAAVQFSFLMENTVVHHLQQLFPLHFWINYSVSEEHAVFTFKGTAGNQNTRCHNSADHNVNLQR